MSLAAEFRSGRWVRNAVEGPPRRRTCFLRDALGLLGFRAVILITGDRARISRRASRGPLFPTLARCRRFLSLPLIHRSIISGDIRMIPDASTGFMKKRANPRGLRLGIEFVDRHVHPVRPIGFAYRPRDIESFCSRKQVGDHKNHQPGIGSKKSGNERPVQ